MQDFLLNPSTIDAIAFITDKMSDAASRGDYTLSFFNRDSDPNIQFILQHMDKFDEMLNDAGYTVFQFSDKYEINWQQESDDDE